MADFNFVAWGNLKQVNKFVLEDGSSGVYRGQCTQTVTQLLRDLGYSGWQSARGNGSQVGATMVARGEAVYVGTNLTSIPANEIHIVCQEVGTGRAGHVSVAAVDDIIFEENVRVGASVFLTANYGIGIVYAGRIGRLSETFRLTRYHYKLTVPTDYDNIDGDDPGGDPTDDPQGPNELRYLKGRVIDIQKSKTNKLNSINDHKDYQIVTSIRGNVGQDI